jgi:hypothetical protein
VGTEVSAPTLYALDPLTHTSHALPTPLPPQIVVTGRSDDVYVSNGNEIWRMLYPAPLPPIPNPTPMLHALPQTAHAMVFDDANDDVVLISRTGRKLMRMNKSLTGIIDQRDIPTSVPMGAHVQLAISPRDPPAQKAVWLWTEGSATLYRLAPNSTGGLTITTLTHAAITNPHGLDFNDQGHMFVSNNGIVVELLQGATGWSVVSPSFFGGLPADRLLRMKRSRTNFTVGVHDQPGWDTNIDPAQLPAGPSHADCAADIAPNLDTDNVVNVNDLLVVITTWGPCASAIRCPADINGDHVVDVNDLLSVITTWGPCP